MLQRLTTRNTPKATQRAARYTPAGGAERCGLCRHFAAPSSCNRIEGPVSAAGWCMLFSRAVTYPHHAGVQSFGAGAPPGVTLDLSFMTPGTMPPGLTFARASVATYFDVTGTMQTAPANAPRWDYDPVAHTLRGLLIEEARTNLLLNSATLGTQSVAVTAQAYTLSFYGTGTVTLSGASTAGPLVGTGAFPTRVSLTFTPTAGTLNCTVTGTVQNAQLEAGGFVTSWIPTTAASATRAVENCTLPTTGWFTAGPSSLAAEYMLAVVSGASRDIASITDGTTTNRLLLRNSGTSVVFVTSIAGTTTTSNTLGTVSTNAVSKVAAAWNGAAGAGSFNGGAVVSNSVGLPASLSTLTVGNLVAPNLFYLDGYVRRVRYWPRALSNTEMQSVTA
jgi:hypothetical protein